MKEILFIETNTTGTGSKAMKIAKKEGYKVNFWTSDLLQYKDMKEDHPLRIADKIVIVDTYNSQEMLEVIKKGNISYSGVLAFDDYHLIPTAKVAEKLSLPGQSVEALENIRNKRKMRDFIKAARFDEVLQPRYLSVSTIEELYTADLFFPCVLKPVDDSGSNGVTLCHTLEDLITALSTEIKRDFNERGYNLTKEYLIEELLNGEEYSAEMLFSNQGWKLISLTEKETFGEHSVECGHVTGRFDFLTEVNIEKKLINLMNLFEIGFGAAHLEFFHTSNGIYLVEINPRLAGDCIPELVELATGIDMIKYMLLKSVNKEVELKYKEMSFASVQFALPYRAGTYTAVKNIEKVKNTPGFVRSYFNNLPTKYTKIKSSYNRLGYVIVKGKNKDTAKYNAKSAIDLLEWSYDND